MHCGQKNVVGVGRQHIIYGVGIWQSRQSISDHVIVALDIQDCVIILSQESLPTTLAPREAPLHVKIFQGMVVGVYIYVGT